MVLRNPGSRSASDFTDMPEMPILFDPASDKSDLLAAREDVLKVAAPVVVARVVRVGPAGG